MAGVLALSQSAFAYQECFEQAATKHGVLSLLLRGIAQVESSNNPAALNTSHVSSTNTVDIGLMQINSGHVRALRQFGITKSDLYEPCTNIHVGAWLVKEHRRGVSSDWEAVGAYNASCTQLKGAACRAARDKYIHKVQRAMQQLSSPSPDRDSLNLAQNTAFKLTKRLNSLDFDTEAINASSSSFSQTP